MAERRPTRPNETNFTKGVSFDTRIVPGIKHVYSQLVCRMAATHVTVQYALLCQLP